MKKENPKEAKKAADLEAQLEKTQADCDHWKNEYYRAYADLDNLRKTLEKDHADAIKYRAEGFLENLLPALDSFYIALASEPTTPEAKNYQIGFKYIYGQLTNVLVNEGVSEVVPAVGAKFDPMTMHAVDVVEGESDGLIAKVLAKGYRLKDRLVRPAMVLVTKKKADEKKEPSDAKPLSDTKEEAHKA
jgi:molecular chaperone GrpE